MDPARWRRVEELFHLAEALKDNEERERFLAEARLMLSTKDSKFDSASWSRDCNIYALPPLNQTRCLAASARLM